MLALAARTAPASAMRRFLLPILLLLCALPAFAQNTGGPAAEKRAALDRLLGTLKAAPSEEVAGPLEQQIRHLWLNAGTPAVTLLMSRGLREMKADATQDAIEDFSAAITLDPNLAEAYHQRAIARFSAGDLPGAIADIQATLQREPRSFAAFQTLAAIAESRKDWKGAYDAWQKVLEVDPEDSRRPGAPEGPAPPRARRGSVAGVLSAMCVVAEPAGRSGAIGVNPPKRLGRFEAGRVGYRRMKKLSFIRHLPHRTRSAMQSIVTGSSGCHMPLPWHRAVW